MADHSTNGAAPLPTAGGPRRAVFVISLICAAQFVLQLDSFGLPRSPPGPATPRRCCPAWC